MGCLNEPGALTAVPPASRTERALTVFCLGALISSLPLAAVAYDWELGSFFSSRFEVDDNLNTSTTPRAAYGASGRGRLTGSAIAPNHRFDLTVDLGYSAFRGIDNELDSRKINNLYALDFRRSMRRIDIVAAASYAEASTFFTEEEDTGETGGDGKRMTHATSAAVTYRLNATDNLTVSANYRNVDFEDADAGLNAFQSWGGSTRFSRQVNRTLSATLDAQANRFLPATSDGSIRYTMRAGLSKRLTNTLSVNANGGIRYVDQLGGGTAATTASDSVGFPIRFGASVTGRDTQAEIGLVREVSASASGGLQGSTALSFSAGYKANDLVTASLSAGYRVSDNANSAGVETQRTNFNVSPSVAYKLTPHWSLNFGYTYRYRETSAGEADSNKVFLTLSHTYLPLP